MKNLIFLSLFFICCINFISEKPFSKSELESYIKTNVNSNITEVQSYQLINDSFFLSIDTFRNAYDNMLEIHPEVKNISKKILDMYPKSYRNINILCNKIINDSNNSIVNIYIRRYMEYYTLIFIMNDFYPEDSSLTYIKQLKSLNIEMKKHENVLRSVFKECRLNPVIDSLYFDNPTYYVRYKTKNDKERVIKDTFDFIEYNNGIFRQIEEQR